MVLARRTSALVAEPAAQTRCVCWRRSIPVVWDRRRFELLWGWAYRFEAYTPVAKRKLGYYALPLLWRDRVVGWGNLSVKDGALQASFGYVGSGRPRGRAFASALDAEVERIRMFLAVRTT